MSEEASSAAHEARTFKKRQRQASSDDPDKSERAKLRREKYEAIVKDLYFDIVNECHLPFAIIEVDRDRFSENFETLNEKWGYGLSWEGADHNKYESITHEEYTYSQNFTDPVFRILAKIAVGEEVGEGDTLAKFKLQLENYPLYIEPRNGIDKDVIKLWCCYLDHEIVHRRISAILKDRTAEESLEVFTVKYALVCWLLAAMGEYSDSKETSQTAIRYLNAYYKAQNTTPNPEEEEMSEVDDDGQGGLASLFTRR